MIAALEAEKEDNVKHVFVQLHFGGCAIIGEGKKLGFSHTFLSYPAPLIKQPVNLNIYLKDPFLSVLLDVLYARPHRLS